MAGKSSTSETLLLSHQSNTTLVQCHGTRSWIKRFRPNGNSGRDALGELRRNSPGRSSLLSRAGWSSHHTKSLPTRSDATSWIRFSHWSNFARLDPKELLMAIDTNSHLIHKYNRLEAIPAMFATPREPSALCVSVMKGLTRRVNRIIR